MPVPSQGHYGFHSFPVVVCLYTYEFWLSLCKIVRSSVILLLPLLTRVYMRFVLLNRVPNVACISWFSVLDCFDCFLFQWSENVRQIQSLWWICLRTFLMIDICLFFLRFVMNITMRIKTLMYVARQINQSKNVIARVCHQLQFHVTFINVNLSQYLISILRNVSLICYRENILKDKIFVSIWQI